VTGPTAPSDARLRRAQALALTSGAGLHIARELITQKLTGQEQVARRELLDDRTADKIAEYRERLSKAENFREISITEALGNLDQLLSRYLTPAARTMLPTFCCCPASCTDIRRTRRRRD
jgi:hypothetical protein